MEKEKIYIYSSGKGYHYNYMCENCKKEYELITGGGRYGDVGPFDCPNCNEKYYATIDDHPDPSLYVSKLGQQPRSLFDDEGRKNSLEIKYNGLGWY